MSKRKESFPLDPPNYAERVQQLEARANASLIAAAPDLLAACDSLLNVLAECEPVVLGESDLAHAHRVARAHARNVIARARGVA